ncbi:MAG: NAD-dependent malic enzyme [Deltaproteobacteria bacterium]|nr:NAD-dependent malic enzyme [Deltaproteobacteria bacterium]
MEPKYQLMRTLRCKDINRPGVLGNLTTTIGKAGGNIGTIRTVRLGHTFIIRDLDIFVDDDEHLNNVVNAVKAIEGVTLLDVIDEVLQLHRGGKIKMVNTFEVKSTNILRKIYTPGVAEVCLRIAKDPSLKNIYTSISRFVAIVTDGSRVLGLGNIGPAAAMPVMEGKAALLHQLVGLGGIPILLDTNDTEATIATVRNIAPTFGGIQLEDIASPRCFDIYARLRDELAIPVMHDDQQGTAVVTLAAIITACKNTGRDIKTAKIGQIGLGASGLVIAETLFKFTGNPVLGTARSEASLKRHEARGGIPSTLTEIMQKADIVVGCSGVKGLIDPKTVRKGQMIFALTNPEPEIDPDVAIKHGAALATDGRSVNNLLCFPGIWKGTFDAGASRINNDMLVAAALAIAEYTPENELMPYILDQDVHRAVTHAVARAAVKTGVARNSLVDDYFVNS